MRISPMLAGAAGCLASVALVSCGGGGSSMSMAPAMMASGYVSTHLISNINTANNPYGTPANVDPRLVNAWGIAFNPQAFVWVANNGSATATLYDGDGVRQALVVAIPAGASGSASPTGIVYNATQSFAVSQNGVIAPAAFIIAGAGGTLAAWSQSVNANSAIVVVDRGAQNKSYTGLAIASAGGAPRLYAADFHNGVVDVYDGNFAPVATPGAFTDPQLPAGFAPFGIQAIGNQIIVTYAKQDAQAAKAVFGAGIGAVDVFDAAGTLTARLVAAGGMLNAPWGIALAPANFGTFSNDPLIGNLGDGRINAFDPMTGAWLGALADGNGTPI